MCSGVDSLEDLDVSIPTCPNASLGDVVEGRVGGWGWGEGSETGCLGDTRFLFGWGWGEGSETGCLGDTRFLFGWGWGEESETGCLGDTRFLFGVDWLGLLFWLGYGWFFTITWGVGFGVGVAADDVLDAGGVGVDSD